MRHKLLASTALTTGTAFVAGAALGADLRMPVKAPPVVQPFSWNGCYVGANAGVVSGHVRQEIIIPGIAVSSSSETGTGFIGGGQIGCNWQYAPNWVAGIEGDINYVDVSRSRRFSSVFAGEDTVVSQATRLHWLGTVRGRLGYGWDRAFLYATGGLAIGNVRSSVSAVVNGSSNFFGSDSDTRVGWTLGAGYEYAFSRTVSGKVEYLHFDLGNSSYSVLGGGTRLPPTWGASAKLSGDIVRVGVNFKFSE